MQHNSAEKMNMSTPNKKDALGKGIRSLLQNIDADLIDDRQYITKMNLPDNSIRLTCAFRLI